MRGRPPKPTALKVLAGNPGHRRLNEQEPKPALGATIPEYLLRFPDAAAAWKRWAPKLQDLGVLTEIDAPAFGRLCRLWAEDQARAIERHPSDPRLLVEIRHLEGRFGMTPADRARIKAEPKKAKSKLARFRGPRQA